MSRGVTPRVSTKLNNMIAEFFGYVAAFCLMVSGLPQVFKTLRDGHAKGLAKPFLFLLLIGFSTMIVYVALTGRQIPLLINYTINLVSYCVITYYKFFPRKHGQAFHS